CVCVWCVFDVAYRVVLCQSLEQQASSKKSNNNGKSKSKSILFICLYVELCLSGQGSTPSSRRCSFSFAAFRFSACLSPRASITLAFPLPWGLRYDFPPRGCGGSCVGS
ncbi:unnamed protein product, partial [Ectocarpus sp. 6 AP-2014]